MGGELWTGCLCLPGPPTVLGWWPEQSLPFSDTTVTRKWLLSQPLCSSKFLTKTRDSHETSPWKLHTSILTNPGGVLPAAYLKTAWICVSLSPRVTFSSHDSYCSLLPSPNSVPWNGQRHWKLVMPSRGEAAATLHCELIYLGLGFPFWTVGWPMDLRTDDERKVPLSKQNVPPESWWGEDPSHPWSSTWNQRLYTCSVPAGRYRNWVRSTKLGEPEVDTKWTRVKNLGMESGEENKIAGGDLG